MIPGNLSHLPPNVAKLETTLPTSRRIPRVTSAWWRFQNGAIGSLMHAALLHGIKYESELEVWGDGYRIVLLDPYDKVNFTHLLGLMFDLNQPVSSLCTFASI